MPDIKAQNETALASVKAIYDAAEAAQADADRAQTAADTAEGHAQTALTNASSAQASADSASEYASRALGNLASVQSVTETLNWITAHGTMTLTSDTALDPSHVYFVVDANGDYTVGGTHYSVVSEPVLADIGSYYELSINESLNNYVATHLVVDTEGLWIIPDSGGNKVLIATGGGSTYSTAGTYIIGKVNNVDTALASFTSRGAQVGERGSAHSVIDANGQRFYASDGTTKLADIGYGSNAMGVKAPFYVFGLPQTGIYGHYSVTEGYLTNATSYASHAEGYHAKANGAHSHAQNYFTIASSDNQTALGKYNIEDTNDEYAVIIGNGTSNTARSNAFTVDWSGNVVASGEVTDGNGITLSSLYHNGIIVVSSATFTSLPQTITYADITSEHVAVNWTLTNPSAQTGDWTVTTSNGSVTIDGTISGSTAITLYLAPTNTADKNGVLVISDTITSLPKTITNADISVNHVLLNSVLSVPSLQTDDWTVTTSDGSVTITGTMASGSTDVTLYLGNQTA